MLCGMRVIAGTHRGRRLASPPGHVLRPTSDRVREALFSILGNRLPQSRFLDLYAGTGAVGIEAASRGATQVTCVEATEYVREFLRQNIAQCEMRNRVTICAQTVDRFFSRPNDWGGPYDIVFVDPPYAAVLDFVALIEGSETTHLFSADSWLIIEHATKTMLPDSVAGTRFRRRYRYGDTTLSVFSSLTPTPS